MAHIILDDRAELIFDGPDATSLLQNVITCNVETLAKGVWQHGALLTPQGKILFDFLISRDGENRYFVDIDKAQVDGFLQRMTMYRLRSNVEISESSESVMRVSWDEALSNGAKDMRFTGVEVRRVFTDHGEPTDRIAYDALRIDHGVPESGHDFTLGDAFPHDVSLDQDGGVDFKKGCYVGQEVVSRVHHRGTARRRILIAETDDTLSLEDKDIQAGGKTLGTLGTFVGDKALALCRIDRVADAIKDGTDIMVGDQMISLNLPPHVTYGWPEKASDDA